MAETQTWQDILAVDDVREMADFADLTTAALQSQYAHAPNFKALASIFHESLDATEQLDQLLKDVADARTADGVFLDWWGERIGVDRMLKVGDRYERLDDEQFRFLLKYRAVCNISNSTAYTINNLLSLLTDTRTFVVDYLDMTISSIIIIGAISDLQAQILANYGLLNRPAGVLANYLLIYPDEQIFGFLGSELQPFNQGVFNPGREIPIT